MRVSGVRAGKRTAYLNHFPAFLSLSREPSIALELARALPFLLLAAVSLVVRWKLPRSTERPFPLIRELLLLFPVVLLYFIARGLTEVDPEAAFANAQRVISFEKALGIFVEPQLQHRFLTSSVVADLLDSIYILGHWPVIVATFVWLAHARPERVALYRNAVILSGAIGIVCFLTFPVAPPRFLPRFGFIDTVEMHSRTYRLFAPPSLTDLFASMPSLHVGWNLLMGIALVREGTRTWVRAFGVIMPITMFTAVVLTANHYIVDALAGAIIVVISLILVGHIKPGRKPSRAT